jgi:hypothetical protein
MFAPTVLIDLLSIKKKITQSGDGDKGETNDTQHEQNSSQRRVLKFSSDEDHEVDNVSKYQ